MVQIVETIKLTVEETEWNKLEYFDSLYNNLLIYNRVVDKPFIYGYI